MVGPGDDPRLPVHGAESDRLVVEREASWWRGMADVMARSSFEELHGMVFEMEAELRLDAGGVRAMSSALIVRGGAGELDFGAVRLVLAGMRATAPYAAARSPAEIREGEDRAARRAAAGARARVVGVSGVGAGGGCRYVGHVVTVIGLIDGVQVRGELADGRLSGSPALVGRVEELIAHGVRVGIGGVVTGAASLHEDRIARATPLAACDGDSGRLGGDPPRIDRIPASAQA